MTSIGMLTHRVGEWRVQFYWPIVRLGRTEFYIKAPTAIRVVWSGRYFGAGLELLGFGVGVDWQQEEPSR